MDSDAIVSVVAYLCDDADLLRDFVARTVAVLEANYAHFELILLDDRSTDRTPQIVGELLARDAGLRDPPGATVGRGSSGGSGPRCGHRRLRRRHAGEFRSTRVNCRYNRSGKSPRRQRPWRYGRSIGWRVVISFVPPILLPHCRPAPPRAIPHDSTGFCVLSRTVVNTIGRTRSKNRHLRLLACTLGYPVTRFRYELVRPLPPQRRRSLPGAFQDALRILVSSSQTPLRLVSAGHLRRLAQSLVCPLCIGRIFLQERGCPRLGNAVVAIGGHVLLRVPHSRVAIGIRRADSDGIAGQPALSRRERPHQRPHGRRRAAERPDRFDRAGRKPEEKR